MQNTRLEQMVFDNKGIIQTADAVDAGISKQIFYRFIKEHNFEQVAHGIYLSPDAWLDTNIHI